MVPVLAVGFEDLKTRIDVQNRQAAVYNAKLQVRTPSLSLFPGSWT
jgi:hypothetical protein